MALFKKEWAAVILALAVTGLGKPAAMAPGRYIVEFLDGLGADSPTFYSKLADSSIDASPHATLAHQLFNGVSFKLADHQDNDTTINIIQSMAMVHKIWPMRLYSTTAKLITSIDGNVLRSPLLREHAEHVETYVPHVMGGVDKLHAEGYTGDGLFIGVVDSGVDYNHPALGGGFGPGHKVIAGYDLVGDAYDGLNNIIPIPDNDPMDCLGHGTHISGIIGADPNPFNFIGVAPKATLGMWKVFGCTGLVTDDILIMAFNMAYEAGVDLISTSIGRVSGWTENPLDVAVQRIAEKGVPCIIGAGNNGTDGLFYTTSASESIGATSVGSIDSLIEPGLELGATYLVNGENSTTFRYFKGKFSDFGTTNVPLYATALDFTQVADGCIPFPANTPNLSPFVILIRLGHCTLDTKIANAQAFSAQRFIFYNLPGIPTLPAQSSFTYPIGIVSDVQGEIWISALKAGSKIMINFINEKDQQKSFLFHDNVRTGGKMSTSSSWGPSFEGWIKPQVSAPGGNILSTLPLSKGGYGVGSGTSMATPFISGVVALIKQIRGKSALYPHTLTSLLSSTATPVKFNDGATTYSYLAPVVQQGGGLVNAHCAAHTTTLLDRDSIPLNDTTYFKAIQYVTISNIGNIAQTYTFANIIAATAFTLSGGTNPSAFPPSLIADTASGATICFEPKNLMVAPKSSKVLKLRFTYPTGLNTTRIPVYSGFVSIKGSAGDSLSLPYAGIATSLKNVQVIDTADGYPYLASSLNISTPITANNTAFVLPGNSTADHSTTSLPALPYSLSMGSILVRLDIQPENHYGLPRIVGEQVLGSVPNYPIAYLVRSRLHAPTWNGQLADGTWASPGKYRFILRALSIFGDPVCYHDYQRYETGLFEIEYASTMKFGSCGRDADGYTTWQP